MTTYGFDAERQEIVAIWSVGVGARACLVAPAAPNGGDELHVILSQELTRLSDALWATYVYPASAAEGEQERQRREEERGELDDVAVHLRNPNLPDESGLMVVSFSPVQEAAHRVGRLLNVFGDERLTSAVEADIALEVDAVVRAELGDLSGRARQAAALDRVDTSPLQVAAADGLLAANPLAETLLTAGLEPAAACVAAAHWLAAAAEVASAVAGPEPEAVFAEADNIQPVSIDVPSLVVARILGGPASPAEVVGELLRVAVAAGRGEIADLPGILVERAQWEELVSRLPEDQQEAVLGEPVRSTPLDPRRPARDLLEHLLDGIASCHLLYREYVLDGPAEEDDEADTDTAVVSVRAAAEDEADEDDDWYEQRERDTEADFVELVRERAAAGRARLL